MGYFADIIKDSRHASHVDQSEVLHVVDVVSYNAEGKIKSIRAYLGRGD